MLARKQILKSGITNASYNAILGEILELGRNRHSSYVCIANVHMLIEAYLDSSFNQVLQEADLVTPDGKPLSIFMNHLFGTSQERVAGPDLMLDILKRAEQERLKVLFYGSTEEVLETICRRLSREMPDLEVVGAISPPFRALSDEETLKMETLINDSGANIVLVGLGCPKQERWMHANKGKIDAVMVGIGAAFSFYSGHLKRCPIWMQNLSLEWLYRLLSEPKRLFRRYFVTNLLFLLLISKQFVQVKFLGRVSY